MIGDAMKSFWEAPFVQQALSMLPGMGQQDAPKPEVVKQEVAKQDEQAVAQAEKSAEKPAEKSAEVVTENAEPKKAEQPNSAPVVDATQAAVQAVSPPPPGVATQVETQVKLPPGLVICPEELMKPKKPVEKVEKPAEKQVVQPKPSIELKKVEGDVKKLILHYHLRINNMNNIELVK